MQAEQSTISETEGEVGAVKSILVMSSGAFLFILCPFFSRRLHIEFDFN